MRDSAGPRSVHAQRAVRILSFVFAGDPRFGRRFALLSVRLRAQSGRSVDRGNAKRRLGQHGVVAARAPADRSADPSGPATPAETHGALGDTATRSTTGFLMTI